MSGGTIGRRGRQGPWRSRVGPPRRLRHAAGTALVVLCLLSPGRSAAQDGQRRLVVSPHGPFIGLAAAVTAAEPNDTILIEPGTYAGGVVIEVPLTILGQGRPVIQGGGRGHVLEARAPVTIQGLLLRGSGARVDAEDAGIMVRGGSARILDNQLEDVLFGIYLKEAPDSEVRGNRVRGKPLSLSRRGDGIRLWQSPRSNVIANRVEGARDVVIYFSDGLEVRDNVVTDGRYGLHYMYSHDNRVVGNRFERNDVGAFVMYSRGLTLESNAFADSRGASGIGIGLKDADGIVALDNLIVGNETGIHLDNSPSDVGASNRFFDNLLLMNDVGIRTLPSVRGNEITGNELVANGRPAEVAGGAARGQADRNRWAGNHWSPYAGFDGDSDARGDTPFIYARLADELLSRYPALAAFEGSPALELVDLLARFFPLLEPEPLLIDPAPRLKPRLASRWASVTDEGGAAAHGWSVAAWAALLLGVAGVFASAKRRLGAG